MIIDLEKLSLEAYERGLKNLEAANKIVLEKNRQCFGLATFNLMFIATVFAFLRDSLNVDIFGIKLSVIFASSVFVNVLSMYSGIRGIRLTEIYLKSNSDSNFKQFDEIQFYIFNKKTDHSELIKKLKTYEVATKPTKFLVVCNVAQLLCVEIGLLVTLLGIIVLIFSPFKSFVH